MNEENGRNGLEMPNCKPTDILNLLREARFVQSVDPKEHGLLLAVAVVRDANKYRLFRSAAYDLLHFHKLFSRRIASRGPRYFDRVALDGPLWTGGVKKLELGSEPGAKEVGHIK